MAFIIFLTSFVVAIELIVLFFYAYYKTKRALLVIQQSGYDNKRLFRYFKEGYKDTFPLNEWMLLIGALITYFINIYLGFIVIFIFAYYNMKFMFKVVTRYQAKKKLVLTARVKRLLVTYVIINIIILAAVILLTKLHATYFFIIIYILSIYLSLLLANLINIPIEKKVKRGFIKQAQAKLEKQSDLLVVGITGSYGKTSIKNIIGEVLSDIEPTLITPESFNTPMGLTITVNNYLDVFHRNFIAEMGAYYTGEIKELAQLVHPKIGIVSSVGPQHLETFKTIENITNTKLELIEALPSDGLGILNYDNEYIRNYHIKNDVNVKYYSLENKDADIYADNINIVDGKTSFDILYQNQKYQVVTKLLGRHNVENILAALLVCEYKDIDITKALKSILKLKPVKHRLEYKVVNKELSIIDDAFNSNPSGIREAINVLNTFSDKKQIIITPGLIDLGTSSKDIHVKLAQELENKVENIYIVGQYNKKYFELGFTRNNINYYDNFIDAYNNAVQIKGEKVILLANDLPDKFR